MLRQDLFQFVERIENIAKGLLVGGLRGGKAGAINTVVDIRIDQVVELIDLAAQIFG